MKYLIITIVIFTMSSCTKKYTWTSIGDSITWQNDHNYSDGSESIGYQNAFIALQETPIKHDNQGYSGLPLTGSDNSIYSKLSDYNFKNSNLVTILVGTNDFKLNKPIHSSDSLNSFSYCLNSLIIKIRNQSPKAKICLLTPLQRNKDGYDIHKINSSGYRLNDYRNEIIFISKKQKLQLIDLYNESGITTQNLHQYTRDGLHPNNEGYLLIAKKLNKHIKLKSF